MIWSTTTSRSKLPPFNSIVSPDTGAAPLTLTLTSPRAGETGDSVNCSRIVSFFVAGSFDTHSSRNDSRATPLTDWVTTVAGVESGTDEMLDEVDDKSTLVVGVLELPALVDAGTRLLPVGAEMIDGVEFGTDDAVEIDGAPVPDDATVTEAGVVTEGESAVVAALVEGAVVSVDDEASGSGASMLRLRSSVAPPHAEARTMSAAITKERRR